MPRRLVRLVLPTPDRSRVLARPNGLAGWVLPVVPVDAAGDDRAWADALTAAAARAVGTPVHLVRPLGDDVWEIEAEGRVPSVGTTWIAPSEAGRLGADARVVEAWAALDQPDG